MSGRAISKLECEKLNQTILKMWEEFKFPEKLTIDDKNRLKKFKDNAYALSMWIKNDTVFYLRNKKVEELYEFNEITPHGFTLDKITQELKNLRLAPVMWMDGEDTVVTL